MLITNVDNVIPYTNIFAEPVPSDSPAFFEIRPRPVMVYNDSNNSLSEIISFLKDEDNIRKASKFFISDMILDKVDSDIPAELFSISFQEYSFIFPEESCAIASTVHDFPIPDDCPIPIELIYWINRISKVNIENSSIKDFIQRWDSEDTLFFVSGYRMPVPVTEETYSSIVHELFPHIEKIKGAFVYQLSSNLKFRNIDLSLSLDSTRFRFVAHQGIEYMVNVRAIEMMQNNKMVYTQCSMF